MAKKKIRNLNELTDELNELQERLDFSEFSFGEVTFNETDLTFGLKDKTLVDQVSRDLRSLANTMQVQSDFFIQIASAEYYRKLLANDSVRAAVQQVVNPQVQPPVDTQTVTNESVDRPTI